MIQTKRHGKHNETKNAILLEVKYNFRSNFLSDFLAGGGQSPLVSRERLVSQRQEGEVTAREIRQSHRVQLYESQ